MLPVLDASHSNGAADDSPSSGSEVPFIVTFPQRNDLNPLQQDEEYAEVQIGNRKQTIRIHDYNSMYARPGLYE